MSEKCWTVFGEFVKEVEATFVKMPEKHEHAIFGTNNLKGSYKPICRALLGKFWKV
jgi:hypothetical protein